MLSIRTTWYEEGHTFALWEPASLRKIQKSYPLFQEQLELFISSYCTHVKGHGGLKEAVCSVYRMMQQLPYIARFDIRHYYQSIDHQWFA